MSDVNVAQPAPAAAPASAPAPAGEVPINPNPTSAPSPVGPQAPEKPVGDVDRGHGRPETRRESIKRAFDKASERTAEADAKRAAPAKKAGDVEAGKQTGDQEDKLNLRQRPEPHREQGRFARRPDAEPGTQQQPGQQQQQPVASKPATPLPETAPYREALPRFSEKAKAEWAGAPESVRGEVYRMAQEFDGAYRKYKADSDTMNTIRNFHEMATQHGTTLARALQNYTSMEAKLRSDVVGGLDVIVNNLNLRAADGTKLGLRDVAYHILNQSPEQHKLTQSQNAQQAANNQIGQLHQMVGSLAESVKALHHDRQFGQTRSAVDQFADDGRHPRFDELGDLIEQELRLGFDLETAYQRAELLRPATRAAQNRNTPALTRSDKSISGAPDSAASNAAQRERRANEKPVGRREAISNAIKRVNGGV